MHLQELKQIRRCRQHLAAPADKIMVVKDLCGVQAQFIPNALHSLHIRCSDFDPDTIGQGLVKNWTLTPQRQAYLSEVIVSAIEQQPYTREELKKLCHAAGMTQTEEKSMFHPWGGGIRELCERGFLSYVVQEKKVFCLSPEFQPIPEGEAKLELCKRYLTHMAPATVQEYVLLLQMLAKTGEDLVVAALSRNS